MSVVSVVAAYAAVTLTGEDVFFKFHFNTQYQINILVNIYGVSLINITY